MTDRPSNNGEYYQTYVRPFLLSVGVPVAPIDLIVNAADTIGGPLTDAIEALLPSPGDTPTPAPSPLALTPIAPSDAMREVAEAVRDAEAKLNEANLAIANASAEVTMLVNIGGVAGANATLNVTIAPTLQNIDE